MIMIAFIAFNSRLVPSNPWKSEFSGFTRNRTDDLGNKSPSLWPTEPHLHVSSLTALLQKNTIHQVFKSLPPYTELNVYCRFTCVTDFIFVVTWLPHLYVWRDSHIVNANCGETTRVYAWHKLIYKYDDLCTWLKGLRYLHNSAAYTT